jgi:hypothetical protein
MVSLLVELFGHFQHAPWTECHTQPTSFASALNDMHLSRPKLLFIPIQGFSPHFHRQDPAFGPVSPSSEGEGGTAGRDSWEGASVPDLSLDRQLDVPQKLTLYQKLRVF